MHETGATSGWTLPGQYYGGEHHQARLGEMHCYPAWGREVEPLNQGMEGRDGVCK